MRILVDRLWPRGMSKERAAIDEWMKEIAPSPELRIWFGHRPERFAMFTEKYELELSKDPIRYKRAVQYAKWRFKNTSRLYTPQKIPSTTTPMFCGIGSFILVPPFNES